MNYTPPNTRARIDARRRNRRGASGRGSVARPGARRVVGAWLRSGRLFSLLLLLSSLAYLGYIFLSDEFTVREIDVQGNNALDAGQVAELVALRGLPIWFIDKVSPSERLHQNAYIERASIEASLPDRVTIRLVERRPEVRWAVSGVQYLVDSGGTVLAAAQDPPAEDVLVVTASGTVLKPGDQVDLDALKLTRTLALRLPVELGINPAIIGWDIGLGVYIKTAAGQTVVFGRSEQLDHKLIILAALEREKTKYTYLDLRPSTPFYKAEGPRICLYG